MKDSATNKFNENVIALTHEDNLDSQDFYELMQAYRHSPFSGSATVDAFEAIKDYVRNHSKKH
jgi:hypothetical protein